MKDGALGSRVTLLRVLAVLAMLAALWLAGGGLGVARGEDGATAEAGGADGNGGLSDFDVSRFGAAGRVVLTDALGKALPEDMKVMAGVKAIQVDAEGSVALLDVAKNFKGYVDVSHPAYGKVRIRSLERMSKKRFALPLVREGAPEAERSVWGRVTDGGGKALKDVAVNAWADGAIEVPPNEVTVISDEEGRFRVLPVSDAVASGTNRVRRTSAESWITVEVKPDDPWYVTWERYVKPGELTIKLHRAKRAHVVKIKDMPEESGGRSTIRADIQSPVLGERVYSWEGIKANGARVPMVEGTYTLKVGSKVYRPLIVRSDSPEELVFEPYPEFVCRGQVVDGKTGMPMKGVVVGWGQNVGMRANLGEVTEAEWNAFSRLKDGENPKDGKSALGRAFGELLASEAVAVTDENGAFTLNFRVHSSRTLVALAKGYMPMRRTLDPMRSGRESGEVRTRPVEMVASAMAVLDPVREEEEPGWNQRTHLAVHAPARWSARYMWEDFFTPMMVIPSVILKSPREVMVPADVPIRFFVTRYDGGDFTYKVPDSPSRWVAKEGVMTFRAGEKREVALVRQEMVKVNVKLLLWNGVPLEGFPVALRVAEAPEVWAHSKPSDKEGMTTLYCPAGEKVKIGLGDVMPGYGKASVDYTVPKGVKEDALTVRISERELGQLGNKNKVDALKKKLGLKLSKGEADED